VKYGSSLQRYVNTVQSSSGTHHSISDESKVQQPCYDCTITKMVIKLQAGPGTGNFRRFTVRKNGVDTALSITFYNSQTYKINQTFISFSTTPFDLISIKEEFQFGSVESAFSLSLVATTSTDRQVLFGRGNSSDITYTFFSSRYNVLFNHDSYSLTDTDYGSTTIACDGEIKNIRLLVEDYPNGSDLDSGYWFSAVRFSADLGSSYYTGPFPSSTYPIAEITGLNTYGESTSIQSLSISKGDRIGMLGSFIPFESYPNNGTSLGTPKYTLDFIPTNSGERFYSGSIYHGGIWGDTYYVSGIGNNYSVALNSQTEVYVVIPTSGTIKNLYISSAITVLNGAPVTFKIRKNSVDTVLTTTLTYPDTTTYNNSASFTVQTGDLISISMFASSYNTRAQGINIGWCFVADNPLETPLLLSSFGYENSDIGAQYRCEDQTSLSGSTLGSYISCGEVGLVFNNVINLDHLEGETVGILANGVYIGSQTVSNGSIILDDSYSKVTVGLLYDSDFETLNVELGGTTNTIQGSKVKIGNTIFRLIDTKGGSIGPNEDNLHEAFTQEAFELSSGEQLTDTELFTGDVRVPLGSGYENGGRVFYRQSNPYPVTISAVIPEVGSIGHTR
jgi:hypothetical protein